MLKQLFASAALERIRAQGGAFDPETLAALNEIRARHPAWVAGPDDRDDFSSFSTSSYGPRGNVSTLATVSAPELVETALQLQENQPFENGDVWRKLCSSDPYRALDGLTADASKGRWTAETWRPFLWAAAEAQNPPLQQRLASKLIEMPEATLQQILPAATSWLQRCRLQLVEIPLGSFGQFLTIWDHLAHLTYVEQQDGVGADTDSDDILSAALGEPGGLLAVALFDLAGDLKPHAGEGFRQEIKKRFEQAITALGRPGLLASAYLLRLLPWLYHIDPTFAACNLVPLLTNPSSNYRSYWKARLYGEVAGNPTLFNLLKGQILNQFRDPPVAASNAGNLILAIFLPMLWKYQNPDGVWDITPQEIRSALTAAPAEIRHVGAWQIFSWMIEKEPGQEPSAERWTKLFGRLFKGCWPHDVSCRDGAISERLVRAATAAGSAFQDAVSAVLPVLVPFDIWSIRTISAEPGMGAQLAHQFPGGMLALLNAIVAPEKAKVPNDLADLLSVCLSADRKLEREPNYQRLHSIARRDAA